MPAPTALLTRPAELAEAQAMPLPQDDDDEILIDASSTAPTATTTTLTSQTSIEDSHTHVDEDGRPRFPVLKEAVLQHRSETRKVPIPRKSTSILAEFTKLRDKSAHRLSPLKSAWLSIYPPLVTHLKLQVRMNSKTRAVELRTSKHTETPDALQKGEDYIKAFTLGFDCDDAIALLRLDDLYIETFEIKDVKTLNGEHLGRAIGRIAGKDGKTKFAIENASKTRVVLADQKIHILGGFKNIHIAREAIVSLILGSPPGKVYGNLRTVASRMKERF